VEEALAHVPAVARELAPSTWGSSKDLSTWDSARVADVCFTARRAELDTVAAAARAGARGPALERAARELLALQSSDWAFLLTRELAADYPRERFRGHAEQHDAALSALRDSRVVPEPCLRSLAPDLDLAPLVAP
jgi:1,4-alpha-glucan branching enzyme